MLGLGERVMLTVDPGQRVGEESALARVQGARGGWLECMIRHAVAIERGAPPPAAGPVFGDVLDVARRALASGSRDQPA
jgi:hypothetical protein